jgi:hypothetical protein
MAYLKKNFNITLLNQTIIILNRWIQKLYLVLEWPNGCSKTMLKNHRHSGIENDDI